MILSIKEKKQDGMILIFAAIMTLIITAAVGSLVGYTRLSIQSHKQALNREVGLNIAEAGLELAVWKLNHQIGYAGETGTAYNNGTYDVAITDLAGGKKLIHIEAFVPNATAPIARREIQATVSVDASAIGFNYGAQVGEGGLVMDNNSRIVGNVYSNGDISGGNNSVITGTAIAANGTSLTANQTNDTPTPPPSVINFRNAAASADAAQSFQVDLTDVVNKVELYIRKVGAPSNFTAIRITNDSSGNPGSTTIASAPLNASGITPSYGWVTANFSTNPLLTAGTTYWLVLDAASNSAANYYQWGANTGYVSGLAKTGIYSAGPWNDTSLDGYFKLYLGGLTHTITDVEIGTSGTGDAKAHTVNNSTIAGTNYCQTGSGNNKACNTSQPDPSPLAMPVTAGNIAEWEADALAGGTVGNQTINGTVSLGPKKINGNLTVNGTLIITGTIWVTGSISVTNSATIRLEGGYGSISGVLMAGTSGSSVNGHIDLGNGAILQGSGIAGSYLILLSQMNSTTNIAIDASNNSITTILYAGTGLIDVSNNARAKEITAYKIHLNNNAEITYEAGLSNAQFGSGPGAGWVVGDQTWQLIR